MSGWTESWLRLAPSFQKQNAPLRGYAFFEFNRKTRQSVREIDCVFGEDAQVMPFMREQFSARRSTAQQRADGLITAFAWGDEQISCTCDEWSLECEGTSCTRGWRWWWWCRGQRSVRKCHVRPGD